MAKLPLMEWLMMERRGEGAEASASTEAKLKLSSPCPSAGLAPVSSAKVAKRSICPTSCEATEAGFTAAGQRRTKDTRCPPSKMSALWPRKGPLGWCPLATSSSILAAGEQPLSEVNRIRVSRSSPFCFKASRILSTSASTCFTKSA